MGTDVGLSKLATDEMGRLFTADTNRSVEELSALDPEYFARAAALHIRPSVLSDSERALLEMSLDVLVTQMDRERLRRSVARCLDAGSTIAEIVSVVEIVALVGLHSITVGFPVLFAHLPVQDRPLRAEEQALLDLMTSDEPRAHTIGQLYQDLVRLDAGFLRDFVAVIDHHYEQGVLSHRFIHLVCILIDVACSHLYEPGIHTHVEQGLAVGCTRHEIAEVIHLASGSGLRTIEIGFAALLDELERRAADAPSNPPTEGPATSGSGTNRSTKERTPT